MDDSFPEKPHEPRGFWQEGTDTPDRHDVQVPEQVGPQFVLMVTV